MTLVSQPHSTPRYIFVFHACVYVVQLVFVRMRSDAVSFVCYLGPTGPLTTCSLAGRVLRDDTDN